MAVPKRDNEHDHTLPNVGVWSSSQITPVFAPEAIAERAAAIREPAHVVRQPETRRLGLAVGGAISTGAVSTDSQRSPAAKPTGGYDWMGTLPALYPEWLGDRGFTQRHGVRFPYIVGAMANGISSAELVVRAGRAGLLAVFGAAGLDLDQIRAGLDEIERELGPDHPWGANLIHTPGDEQFEHAVVELFLERDVRCVSASGFIKLTPAVVQYACSGLHTDASGRIRRPNRLIAKVSRMEVARRFVSPAPERILGSLVERGKLTRREAQLARRVPLAADITAEADSGGHTDSRPMPTVLPSIRALVDEVLRDRDYDASTTIRVGAAGGLGTPRAVASAFALGADYVVTGSVNQACLESGLSQTGKQLLADIAPTDVAMAPSADRLKHGSKVQVLRRGTLFAPRASRLGELYRRYDSLEALPDSEREFLEETIFEASIDEIWQQTRRYWQERNPDQLERARRSPRHRMALLFRWYLGRASIWAFEGNDERRADYQIWCGPAMGAFNRWAAGSFLEAPAERSVVQVALNLLEGAAVVTRGHQLRTWGLPADPSAFDFRPRPLQ